MVPLICLMLVVSSFPPPEPDPLSQAGELWSACAKGSPDACYKLGKLRTRRIVDADARATATAPYEKACLSGDSTACYVLAMHLDDDGGLPLDGKRAFELFTTSCESGFAPACERASVFYRVSVPSQEPDAPKTAASLLARACDAGLAHACYDLAQAGSVGGVEPVDEATESKLLERGCTLGSFAACLEIARRFLPEPPFACDQCEPNAIERGDERCITCELAACRRLHCCPTCKDRNSYACCCEEFDAPLPYPLKTPPVDPKKLAVNQAGAKAILATSVRRLRALCKDGFTAACKDLDDLFSIPRLPYFGRTR